MADNVQVEEGVGTAIAADELTDATLGLSKVQFVKLMDGTLGGTNKAKILGASTSPSSTDPAIVVAVSPNGQNANGLNTMTNSSPVVLASNQKFFANTYEAVAASATAQVLGLGAGATGDYIAGVLIIPATTTPGAVTLLDNAISIPLFVGGTITSLAPFYAHLGMVSQSGAWKLTTGTNVSCIAMGSFT